MSMQQNRYRRGVFLNAFVLLLSAALAASCGDSKADGPASNAQSSPVERIIPVKVQSVAAVPFEVTLQLTGYIKSLEDVTISVEEGGVVRQWEAERGDVVRQGTVIALLNDDLLRPMYEAAKAQYQIAEMNYQKQQKVFSDQGVSEMQVKTSEYTRDAAKAQAELAKARFERTRIKSPITGILDDRLIDEGELAPPGAPIARMVNLDRIKVLFNAPENYAGTLTRGTPVEVSVTAFPREKFMGKISFIGSAVSPDNRTIPVEVLLRNPGRKLKPDMIARASITQSLRRSTILVDESVLQQVDEKTHVVYVENAGKAQRRVVTLGARSDSRVEILTGLQAGDRVIVSGYQNVFDGQMVEVKQ